MFILGRNEVKKYNLDQASEFVEFWSNCYGYNVNNIDYKKELNIGNKLTEKNVKNILHWKSPRNTGEKSKIVKRSIKDIDKLNDFRNGNISEDKFKEITKQIIPNGIVFQIFLFHICRPEEYPIFDNNVLISCYTHGKCSSDKIGWNTYEEYKSYFNEYAYVLD